MTKWFIIFMFLVIFPFAAYAQSDPIAQTNTLMENWIAQKLGIQIPEISLSQDWQNTPIIGGCQYEWYAKLGDIKFQVKDGYDNYYRVSYQDNTVTVDFIREFNAFFGG